MLPSPIPTPPDTTDTDPSFGLEKALCFQQQQQHDITYASRHIRHDMVHREAVRQRGAGRCISLDDLLLQRLHALVQVGLISARAPGPCRRLLDYRWWMCLSSFNLDCLSAISGVKPPRLSMQSNCFLMEASQGVITHLPPGWGAAAGCCTPASPAPGTPAISVYEIKGGYGDWSIAHQKRKDGLRSTTSAERGERGAATRSS